MKTWDVEFYCTIGRAERELMRRIYEKYDLSARSYHKILKVARTIADLSGHSTISTEDISEAVFYKCLDGRYWANLEIKFSDFDFLELEFSTSSRILDTVHSVPGPWSARAVE